MLIPRNLNLLQLYLIDEDRCDEAEQQIECVPLYKAVYFLLIPTLCRCFLYLSEVLLACCTRELPPCLGLPSVWTAGGWAHSPEGLCCSTLNRGGVAANLNCLGFCTQLCSQAQIVKMVSQLHGSSYTECCTQCSDADVDIFKVFSDWMEGSGDSFPCWLIIWEHFQFLFVFFILMDRLLF